MHIIRMHKLTTLTLVQILALYPWTDEEPTLKTYKDYLSLGIDDSMGLFGAFDDNGQLWVYLHAEAPHPLTPSEGYMILAATKKGCPKEVAQAVLEAAESFLRDKGSQRWVMVTKRSPRAFKRAYGASEGQYKILEKDINVEA